MTDIDRIVKFFLHIFQLQSGVSGDLEGVGEHQLVSPEGDPAQIYQLRIKVSSGWKERRMSIRQIGDAGDSKSTCYVVTYDDLLVVKIPPRPLPDFQKYLESINIERRISDQLLSDIYCVSPNLSCILNKFPEVAGKIPQESKDAENRYIDLLIKEPRYQSYLKIGDRFSFFMSLSRHPFFDQVIEKMHGNKRSIQDEVYKNSRIFQSEEAFESVYGDKNIDIYDRIHKMFKDFSRKVDAMLTLYENYLPLEDYQKQEWMFAALAEKEVDFRGTGVPSEFGKDIRNLLLAIIDDNKECVEQYKKIASAYVRRTNFAKYKSRIEILIIKTLELMYHLKDKRVAIRDLKPDNILIAGDISESSFWHADPQKYDLGLIDLETAVGLGQSNPSPVYQPMLAGTPAYMTPSHMFENQVLLDAFGADIFRTFYMQDWFSAIGIIYAASTGGKLFAKTARLTPEIIRIRRKGIRDKRPAVEILRNVSRNFWKSAADELSEKISREQRFLQSIHLTLPEHIGDMFKDELQKEKKLLTDMIAYCARSQKILPQKEREIIDATHEDIRGQRMALESSEDNIQMPPEIRQKAIKLLEFIETMKFKLKNFSTHEEPITEPITCDELLIFLFRRVNNAMNRESFLRDKSAN